MEIWHYYRTSLPCQFQSHKPLHLLQLCLQQLKRQSKVTCWGGVSISHKNAFFRCYKDLLPKGSGVSRMRVKKSRGGATGFTDYHGGGSGVREDFQIVFKL